MTPRIEQVTFKPIPWQTIISAVQVAFGSDAANWEITMVEAEEATPEHLTVTPKTSNPNAVGKIKTTFLVFTDRIAQPTGNLRLVFYVWSPRSGGGQVVADFHYELLTVVPHYCDVAEAIALQWRQMEINQALRVAFDEPEPGFDIGDSAFDEGSEEGNNPVLVNFQTGEVKPDPNSDGNQGNGDGYTNINF